MDMSTYKEGNETLVFVLDDRFQKPISTEAQIFVALDVSHLH